MFCVNLTCLCVDCLFGRAVLRGLLDFFCFGVGVLFGGLVLVLLVRLLVACVCLCWICFVVLRLLYC